MTLQPEDFWSFSEWLMRPQSFLESALLQGIVLFVLAILLGLLVGYLVSAVRYGPSEGFYAVARAVRDLVRSDLPGTSARRIFALARLAYKEAIRRRVLGGRWIVCRGIVIRRLVFGPAKQRSRTPLYKFCVDGDELFDFVVSPVYQHVQFAS